MRYLGSILILLTTVIFAKSSLIVEVYELENGLTVMLNPDKNEPIVYGAVGVKGGGKQDPADATGIAHYLEHMLFKGTQELGTVNYEAEKVFLDSIETLYDELGNTTDDDSRQKIICYLVEKQNSYTLGIQGEKIKLDDLDIVNLKKYKSRLVKSANLYL